jgi:hypothetical protein
MGHETTGEERHYGPFGWAHEPKSMMGSLRPQTRLGNGMKR